MLTHRTLYYTIQVQKTVLIPAGRLTISTVNYIIIFEITYIFQCKGIIMMKNRIPQKIISKGLLCVMANYSILLFCAVGFRAGAMTLLCLPLFQLLLSCFNYHFAQNWKRVLLLQLNLLISTLAGIVLTGYLYLEFICYDAAGALVMVAAFRIGSILVSFLGILTTLIKFASGRIRSSKNQDNIA